MGRKVLIAEQRAGRPNDFVGVDAAEPANATGCAFCVGQEHQTPPSLLEFPGDPDSWQVRVVSNKYPAVSINAPDVFEAGSDEGRITSPPHPLPFGEGRVRGHLNPQAIFPSPYSSQDSKVRPAFGAHEIVVESPRHVRDVDDLTVDQLADVVRVYRDRLQHWAGDARMRHATVFKNVGFAAGASLEHIHSQIVALPFVPATMEEELRGAKRFFDKQGSCVFCQLVQDVLVNRDRFAAENDFFVAFCAYAGRQPFETWILPKAHASRYEELTDEAANQLARILQQIVVRLRSLLTQLSYNLILHTMPFGDCETDYYHWHLELIPRSNQLAGLELGTGVYVNPLAPERAAELLRQDAV